MDLTQNELDQLRTAMNAELDRLIAARKPEVKQWPQVGDEHFYITVVDGCLVVESESTEKCDLLWNELGVIFKTRAEAERRAEALKVQAELRRMLGVVAWQKGSYQFAIQLNAKDTSEFTFVHGSFWCPCAVVCGVFFDSEKAAKYALNTIGQERLHLWLDDYLQTPIGGE